MPQRPYNLTEDKVINWTLLPDVKKLNHPNISNLKRMTAHGATWQRGEWWSVVSIKKREVLDNGLNFFLLVIESLVNRLEAPYAMLGQHCIPVFMLIHPQKSIGNRLFQTICSQKKGKNQSQNYLSSTQTPSDRHPFWVKGGWSRENAMLLPIAY